MEEVWKDIGLTMSDEVILPHHQNKHQHNHPMIFQDFFSKQGQSNNAALSSSRTAVSPSPPPTMLTLMSSAARGGSSTLVHQSPRDVYYGQHPLNGNVVVPLVEDLNVNNNVGKQKRLSDADGNSAVRRHKRLVKNRESAARSRARKQELISAYTNELEHEVAQLMEENARLREQQQQLETAAASVATHQHERKRSLYRTSTAPF